MPLFIGGGFGNFSRIIGPWQEYFPINLAAVDSQFDIGIATEIIGGARGATITSIDAEPPFNIVGSLATQVWRVAVLEGRTPATIKPFQEATQGWPRRGDSDQPQRVKWSKLTAKKVAPNNYANTFEPPTHWDFPDLCGPSVGPGEIMTVIFVPLFNETGAGFGAGNQTYASLSVYGVLDSARNRTGERDTAGRSIPRGKISGI